MMKSLWLSWLILGALGAFILYNLQGWAQAPGVTHWLAKYTITFLNANWVILVMGAVLSWSLFANNFSQLTRKQIYFLSALVVGLTFLVAFKVPPVSRILFDEQIYAHQGQSIAHVGRSEMCAHGNGQNGEYICFIPEYNKQPNGWPFLISRAYQVFGTSEQVAFRVNNAIFLVTLILAFVFFNQLTRNFWLSVFGMIVVGGTPAFLQWSHTIASEPSAVMMMFLSAVALMNFMKEKTLGTSMLLVSSLVLAAQIRTEMITFPVFILCAGLLSDQKFWKSKEWPQVLSAALLLIVPALIHILFFRNDSWGAVNTERFSMIHFWPNLKVNGSFYFTNIRFPAMVTILAIIGLFNLSRWRWTLVGVALLTYTFGIYLFFYAGSYDYGADVRFSLMTLFALSLLAVFGLELIWSFWSLMKWNERLKVPIFMMALILTILSFFPYATRVGNLSRQAQLDVDYSRELVSHLPENSVVLTHNPNILILRGYNAMQVHLAQSRGKDFIHTFRQYNNEVYFYWNFWCNTTPDMRKMCQWVLDNFISTEVEIRMQHGYRFGLYRLQMKPTESANP